MTLRLGVIGISEGNGHPYSWSAILNGYSHKAMADCCFPAIDIDDEDDLRTAEAVGRMRTADGSGRA